MNFQNGWTWYCQTHESAGFAATEKEAEALAKSHLGFFETSDPSCQLFLKDQATASAKPMGRQETQVKKPSNMAIVKENFARAWQKWDEAEDARLKENFDNRKSLEEMIQIHQRAKGGVIARLKKLGLINEELEPSMVDELLANRHLKLMNEKTFKSNLRVQDGASEVQRYERGKESLREFGTVNPPPVPLPDLSHTATYSCSVCGKPVIGNSCLCRNAR